MGDVSLDLGVVALDQAELRARLARLLPTLEEESSEPSDPTAIVVHRIEAMGDAPLGVITTQHYSVAHDSPENKIFLKAYAEVAGTKQRANFMAVGAWDGMAAMYEVARRLNGKIDGDKAMEILKGMKINSPRGPLEIDAATRDPIETIYVRKVERAKDGKLYNVEFDKFLNVKDPNK